MFAPLETKISAPLSLINILQITTLYKGTATWETINKYYKFIRKIHTKSWA